MPDARRSAAETLLALETRHATVHAVWDGPRASAETALVLGTLRRRGTLDAVLRAYSTRKLAALKPETRAVLRAALFEILYLDDTPPHAVVHAAVENARELGREADAGFVNALLRSILRGRRRVPGGEADLPSSGGDGGGGDPRSSDDTKPVPGDPRRTVPRDGGAWVLGEAVFPDPESRPGDYLSARGSTSLWIARRRLAELGFPRALRCLDLQASTPATHLRAAPGHEDDVKAALTAMGVAWRDGPHGLITLPPRARIGEVFDACGQWVVVQDAVASLVAPFVAPPAGARVLDLCAAPGGKATHLAQLVGPSGEVTAWDVDEERLAMVRENAQRLSLPQLRCALPEGEYDAVLADVPCSNTGVLARRPEARWRVRERHLRGLAERQLKIAREAAHRVRAGGILVYSTCSLEPEENLGVVHDLLRLEKGFALGEARTIYPDEGWGDGGFMARLVRV
jgi:16S rRNA (cytosine967-C5)-methyltransferase